MASLVAETQLEKDVANNAGVIPIWPWLDETGKTKDGLLPNIYANMLLQAKRDNGQAGIIKRCDHDGCEHDYKAMFWRSADTPENIVPVGWTDFGGPHHFTECPNCRARDIRDIGLDEFMEDGRVDANLKHGSTGSSGTSDKPLHESNEVPSSSRPTQRWVQYGRRQESELKKEAKKLFKNHPEHLKAALQEIDKDEREKRANAAQYRKRKKDDEEYYEKRKKTKIKGQRGFIGGAYRRKKKTRKRRKKRTRRRRKSRRKSRRKKKHRKKRTRRRK